MAALAPAAGEEAEIEARFLLEASRDEGWLRKAVERHRFSWNDTVIPVTISLGLASKLGAEIPTVEEMIAESDKLLYIAKENGRNQVVTA